MCPKLVWFKATATRYARNRRICKSRNQILSASTSVAHVLSILDIAGSIVLELLDFSESMQGKLVVALFKALLKPNT